MLHVNHYILKTPKWINKIPLLEKKTPSFHPSVTKLSSWRGLPNNPLFGIFCYILRGFFNKRSGVFEGGWPTLS
jgi:hypothetical protein